MRVRRVGRLGASVREEAGWGEGWTGDLRYAVRTLARSPGLTAGATATLALGIGANAAVFGLVDQVLFRPPPFERAGELVLIWSQRPEAPGRIPVAAPDAAVLAERSSRLGGVEFLGRPRNAGLEVREGDGARHVRVASVTTGFFRLLGVDAAVGRTFRDTDGPSPASGAAGPTPVAVLADGVWREAFGSDPGVVGRTVLVDGAPMTVVGVMPPGFALELPPGLGMDTRIDVWTSLPGPLASLRRSDGRRVDQDSDNRGAVIARLAPRASLEQAAAEVDRLSGELRSRVPAHAEAGLGFDVRPLHADATAHARPVLLMLMAGVGLVMVVACLNLATVLVARGARRRGELALRVALGAGRGRIARQVMVEAVVLVVLGAGAALLLAWTLAPLLQTLVPAELAGRTGGARVGGRVLGFTAAVAAGVLLLFGLVPAVQAGRVEGRGALRSAIVRGGRPRGLRGRALAVAQVALAVVLIVGAGLYVRSIRALEDVRPGFEPAGALTFRVSVRIPGRYTSPGDRARLMKEIEGSVAALPGVEAVGLVGVLPLGGGRWTQPWGRPGEAESEWSTHEADFRVISSGYFAAMGVRILEGRAFTSREDVQEDERVVVVDEKLAREVTSSGSAVGAVVGIPLDGSAVWARIIGVVEHVRHETLEADGRPAIYVPYRQEASREVAFVVRASRDPAGLSPAVRRAVSSVDPRIPVYDLRTLEDYVAAAVAPRRFGLGLLTTFAGLALLLAMVGLYGVIALEVGRRRREMGVRLAMGARRAQVVRSVVAGGLRIGGLGLLAGGALTVIGSPLLEAVVFDVRVMDATTWAATTCVVLAVTVAASWLPARRAARTEPREVLAAD